MLKVLVVLSLVVLFNGDGLEGWAAPLLLFAVGFCLRSAKASVLPTRFTLLQMLWAATIIAVFCGVAAYVRG
jgi:hypothetical protein